MYNSVLQRHWSSLTGLAVFLLIAVSISVLTESDVVAAEETGNATVEWVNTVEDALKQSTETGKPIMMDFYTDW